MIIFPLFSSHFPQLHHFFPTLLFYNYIFPLFPHFLYLSLSICIYKLVDGWRYNTSINPSIYLYIYLFDTSSRGDLPDQYRQATGQRALQRVHQQKSVLHWQRLQRNGNIFWLFPPRFTALLFYFFYISLYIKRHDS